MDATNERKAKAQTPRRMPFLFFRAAAVLMMAVSGAAAGMTALSDATDARPSERSRAMLDEIVSMARATAGETGRAELSARTLDAMARVPRHRFVSAGDEVAAYRNRPLAIGHGQTISQPYIVALMTDLLELRPSDRVLEIGTGSGYQTAVLAQLAARVYSIEIVESLARGAAARLKALGYGNIETKVGDGYQGWREHAPFDAIVVTAAPEETPPALIEQLKRNGRLVIPLGKRDGAQMLYLMRKRGDDSLERRAVLQVRFVPFTGGGAQDSKP